MNKENESYDIFEKHRILDFKIDENFEFVPKGKIFRFFSDLLYYGIAYPILWIVLKIVYNFKIEGKENLKEIETGAISVSNHVLILDCAMIGLAFNTKRLYYTVLESQFKIPMLEN